MAALRSTAPIFTADRRRSSSLPASAASSNALTALTVRCLASSDTVGEWGDGNVAADGGLADQLPTASPSTKRLHATGDRICLRPPQPTSMKLHLPHSRQRIACIRRQQRQRKLEASSRRVLSPAAEGRMRCVRVGRSSALVHGRGGHDGMLLGGFVLQAAALASAARAAPGPSPRRLAGRRHDRASDDMHWMGGSLLGENLAWGRGCSAAAAPRAVDTAAFRRHRIAGQVSSETSPRQTTRSARM